MSKLLISDYDKTLCSNINDVRLNIKAIAEFKAKGNKFVIATARPYQSICKEIETHEIPIDYLICNCGNTLYDNNGKCLDANYLDHQVVENLVVFLSKLDILEKVDFFDEWRINNNSFDVVEVGGKKIPFIKLQELIHYIHRNYPSLFIFIYDFSNFYLGNKSDKVDEINKLLYLLNESYDEIITVGDNMNDYEMIRKFNGYRMDKSSLGLKLRYAKCTPSVREIIK